VGPCDKVRLIPSKAKRYCDEETEED